MVGEDIIYMGGKKSQNSCNNLNLFYFPPGNGLGLLFSLHAGTSNVYNTSSMHHLSRYAASPQPKKSSSSSHDAVYTEITA
jgi:hypothetical protein